MRDWFGWIEPEYRKAIKELLNGAVVLLLIFGVKRLFEFVEGSHLHDYRGPGEEYIHYIDIGFTLVGPLFIALHLVKLLLIYVRLEFFPRKSRGDDHGNSDS